MIRKSRIRLAPSPEHWFFPADRPLDPDRLIGRRRALAAALAEGLRRGEHQVLTGVPSSGKTSVARAAIALVEADGWQRISVNLFRMSGRPALIERLLNGSRQLGEPDHASASNATNGGTPVNGRPPVGERSGPDRPDLAEESQFAGVTDAIRRLQEAADVAERRVVLLVDELQELATTRVFGEIDELTSELRLALNESPRVTCVFVGSAPCVMRHLFSSSDQPLDGLAEITRLPPIDAADWHDGLESRFHEGGREIEESALRLLVALGDGHPRSTMLIAQRALAKARARKKSWIDRGIVKEGFESALAQERVAQEIEFGRVRTVAKHALLVATALARGDSPYKRLPSAVARQTLRSLEIAGVVDHRRKGKWQVPDPLFRSHLLRVVDREELDEVEVVTRQQAALGTEFEVEVSPGAIMAQSLNGGGTTEEAAIAADDGEEAERADEEPEAKKDRQPDAEEEQSGERQAKREHEPVVAAPPAVPDRSELLFRHPRAKESARIAKLVGVAAGRSNGHGLPGSSPQSRESASARLARFIERMVARGSGWYWQLERDRRALGGLVLYRPGPIVGPRTTSGIDPLVHLGFLAAVLTVVVAGLAIFIIERAWLWGGQGALFLAVFAACLLQAMLAVPQAVGQARSSWIARRRKGAVFEGVWSQPDALPEVFRTLATELPGTLLTTYTERDDLRVAFRDLGFRVDQLGVVAGVLVGSEGKPVRPELPSRKDQQPPSAAGNHGRGPLLLARDRPQARDQRSGSCAGGQASAAVDTGAGARRVTARAGRGPRAKRRRARRRRRA